jgi:hypothetical protein
VISVNKTQNDFLALVRIGIGHSMQDSIADVDWKAVQNLAVRQGLLAIALDGVEALRDRDATVVLPEKKVLTQWIGEVLKGYEKRYELYCRVIAEMAGFYNSHGFKMMVIKGYACSLDWPKPEHRPTGDIDIWQFGDYKRADAALVSEKGIMVDSSHQHHTVFSCHGFPVENHYDFINVHHHKSHKALERILKEKAQDDSFSTLLYGEKVCLPSPNLHALFLLKHMMLHFASGEINCRQLLDWAFFVEKHGSEVDWKWFLSVLDDFHMRDFFDIANAVCVENLGFNSCIFPDVQFNPVLKDRVLDDIMNPKFGQKPTNLFVRIIWKIRRWRANAWKHELCYKESLWSAFWSGVWNHLLKPSSI